eukprot:6492033-Amphidinium_carterae.2
MENEDHRYPAILCPEANVTPLRVYHAVTAYEQCVQPCATGTWVCVCVCVCAWPKASMQNMDAGLLPWDCYHRDSHRFPTQGRAMYDAKNKIKTTTEISGLRQSMKQLLQKES